MWWVAAGVEVVVEVEVEVDGRRAHLQRSFNECDSSFCQELRAGIGSSEFVQLIVV